MGSDKILINELGFRRLTSINDLVYYKNVGYNQLHITIYDTGFTTMKLMSRDLEITRHRPSINTEGDLREFVSKFYFLLSKIGVDTNETY